MMCQLQVFSSFRNLALLLDRSSVQTVRGRWQHHVGPFSSEGIDEKQDRRVAHHQPRNDTSSSSRQSPLSSRVTFDGK